MAEILTRLSRVPLTYVYLIILVLVIVPLIMPLNLPISMDAKAVQFYNAIDSLPEGSKVLFDPEFSPGTYATYESVAIRFVEHCYRKGLKVYIYSTIAMAPIVKDWIVANTPSFNEMEYGVDWIHFGYIPGNPDIAKSLFATDIRAAFAQDYEEKLPLDEFPMMQGVNAVSDFDLFFDIYTGIETLDSNLRQWILPNYPDLIWIESPNQVDAPASLTYFQSGHLSGVLYNPAMYATYEKLTNMPGDQIKSLDVLSMTEIFAVILVVIGNASYFIGRKNAGRTEV